MADTSRQRLQKEDSLDVLAHAVATSIHSPPHIKRRERLHIRPFDGHMHLVEATQRYVSSFILRLRIGARDPYAPPTPTPPLCPLSFETRNDALPLLDMHDISPSGGSEPG